jgi:P-type Ca2+ transporter type 2C
VAVTLALGVLRMTKYKTIIKKLASVEALGCVDVLCVDKTGTITENKMIVNRIYADGNMQDETNFLDTKNSHYMKLLEV